MQKPHRFLTTSHRRRRLVLWAIAMLSWFAAVLFAGRRIARRHVRQREVSLAELKRLTLQLMIVRAAELARAGPLKRLRFWRRGRDTRPPHIVRSLIGSRLRRAMKRRDLAARIAALIAVLRTLDAHALQLAHRMKRRLTRLWPIRATPAPAVANPGAPAPTPAFANSS